MIAVNPTSTCVIAGGTALTRAINEQRLDAERLVSLAQIVQADVIRIEDSRVHIGPLVTMTQMASAAVTEPGLDVLVDACREVGHRRIQNQASIVGNIAEADDATDIPAALLALNAVVHITSPEGSRDVPLEAFITGAFKTVLEANELIMGISVDLLPAEWRSLYHKYRSRSSEDRPCVGVAVAAKFNGDAISELRVAVGGACEKAQRLPSAEALAQGKPLAQDVIAQVATAYSDQIEPIDNMRGSAWYHRRMIRVHVQRALEAIVV